MVETDFSIPEHMATTHSKPQTTCQIGFSGESISEPLQEARHRLINLLDGFRGESNRPGSRASLRDLARIVCIRPQTFQELLGRALPMVFFSWNINTIIGRPSEPGRMPIILDHIRRAVETQRPSFIHIQEARRCVIERPDGTIEEFDSITAPVDLLKSLGYRVLIQSYLDGEEKALQYITAFDKDRFEFCRREVLYMTRTPGHPTVREGVSQEDIRYNNYGEFYERCVFTVQVLDRAAGCEYALINVHQAMGKESRIEGMRLIKTLIDSYPEPFGIFVSGDFNTFPNAGSGGLDQLAIMDSIEKVVQLSLPRSSFIPDLYDLIPDVRKRFNHALENLKPGTQEFRDRMIEIWEGLHGPPPPAVEGSLDHMFLRIPQGKVEAFGIVLASGREGLTSDVTRLFDGTAADEEIESLSETLRRWKIQCARDRVPEFGSDHQILVAKARSGFCILTELEEIPEDWESLIALGQKYRHVSMCLGGILAILAKDLVAQGTGSDTADAFPELHTCE